MLGARTNRLFIVHWADSLEEAEAFEKSVSKLVHGNGGESPYGRFSRGHHAVYLSWNEASPVKRPFRIDVEVTSLPGLRCWPTAASHFRMLHLMSPLPSREAENILVRFAEREAQFLKWRREQR